MFDVFYVEFGITLVYLHVLAINISFSSVARHQPGRQKHVFWPVQLLLFIADLD